MRALLYFALLVAHSRTKGVILAEPLARFKRIPSLDAEQKDLL